MADYPEIASSVRQILDSIKANVNIGEDVISDLLQDTYSLLGEGSDKYYNLCLSIICHVAERLMPLDDFNQVLFEDCVRKSRIYLYEDMLPEGTIKSTYSLTDEMAKDFYTLDKTETVLTRDQKTVYDSFIENKRIVVSAPTSFGKTRVLEEILCNSEYKLSILIFPTIALLAEQFKKLRSNPLLADYVISTSSKIKLNTTDNKYILLFTPERLSLFMSIENNSTYSVNFFSIDEIYKADQKQEEDRHFFFADALYNLAKYNSSAHFYLLGPYISGFSQSFTEKFGAKLLIFKSEVVQKDYFKLADMKKDLSFTGISSSTGKQKLLAETIRTLTEKRMQKNLIFCGSKSNTKTAARIAAESVNHEQYSQLNDDLCKYIAENISPHWSLIDYIKRGVAFHNSAMPRHVQELIVDAFEDKGGSLHSLACTTTLTEGINTSAKNIIFYDHKIRGSQSDHIDAFVRKNIEGRAGRLSKHFIGNIYYVDKDINKILEVDDGEMTVDLEFFDSEKPSIEAIIQVDKDDLSAANKAGVEIIEALCLKNRIPLSLVKSNKFIPIANQIEVVNLLRQKKFQFEFDNYQSLCSLFEITHDSLFNDRDKADSFTRENYLIPKSVNYVMAPKSLKQSIEIDLWRARTRKKDIDPDTVISDSIRFHYKYFEYAWPRYLTVFGSLYNFVQAELDRPLLNFDTLVAKLEYGTAEVHEMLLKEAGLPNDVITKIQQLYRQCENPEDVYRITEARKAEIRSLLTSVEYRVFNYYL